jgi:DNA-binding NarL/FixJ family response regulator
VIRVLLVDDQSLLPMAFRLILEAESGIEVIGEAADGATGISMASALHPDAVLMDVRMPGMDGIQATFSIAAGPAGKVRILATFDLDHPRPPSRVTAYEPTLPRTSKDPARQASVSGHQAETVRS